MKQIPLTRKRDALFIWGKINGSVNIEFLLDTGCTTTLLSRELGDILFLKGNLVESDVKGNSTSSFGGIYSVEQKDVNIRRLTFGKVKLKGVNASICDRYGGPTLLGMAALDKMNGYSITKDALTIDDGDPGTVITTGKAKITKPNKTRFKSCIQRLRKIREESGVEDFKFDYAKHILRINHVIQSCLPLLLDKKFKLVFELLAIPTGS